MSQYKKDMLSSLIFLVLGIAVLISAAVTIKDPGTMQIGPAFFPNFIGGCMIVLSTVLGITTWLKERNRRKASCTENGETSSETPEEKKRKHANELRAVGSAGIMLGYVLLFDKLGYFLSTFLAVTALLALLKVKKPLSYLICYIAGVAVWACFTYIFSVRLP